MNSINQAQTLSDLPDFQRKYILYKTSSELFKNMGDQESLKDFIEHRFDAVYLLEINPQDKEKYAQNYEISDIINRYSYYAENRPISLMIFQLNETMRQKSQEIYEEMKAQYGDTVMLDNTKYRCIVGVFGGTSGRTNQFFIDKIRSEIPVTILTS